MFSIPTEARAMIDAGALVVVNHSGGKDSQAMLALVCQSVSRDRILVVHAHLPEVEWEGTWEHVQATSAAWDVPAIQVQAGKTFLEMVERRGMWPSASTRQCTSDLKRGPIDKAVRHYLKDNPRFGGQVISAMGMRAEESSARAKQPTWKREDRNCRAGREWFRWLPIHDLTADQVFGIIAGVGQKPHWAYAEGMTRLSCVFCIMSSRCDLQTAARLRPALYRRYVETEQRLNHTMNMAGKPLEEITGIPAREPEAVGNV